MMIRARAQRSLTQRLLGPLLVCLVGLVALPGAAWAQANPVLKISSIANTTAAPGSQLLFRIQVQDQSTASTTSAPITFDYTLPAGMTAASISDNFASFNCGPSFAGSSTGTCTGSGTLGPINQGLVGLIGFTVNVAPSASGVLTTQFGISGGGSAADSTVDPTTIAASPPPFGIDAFDAGATDSSGAAVTQAGGHPFASSSTVNINTETNSNPILGDLWPVEPMKDVTVDLPPGLVGGTAGLPQCTIGELAYFPPGTGVAYDEPQCAQGSQVGMATLRFNPLSSLASLFPSEYRVPVFNMIPSPGSPATFGFIVSGTVATIDAGVRTGGDYGLSLTSTDISEGLNLAGVSVTIWGTPADPVHDFDRHCQGQLISIAGCSAGQPLLSILRNPTSCVAAGDLKWGLTVDSWFGSTASETIDAHAAPGYPYAPSGWGAPVGVDGCASVPFTPTVTAAPTSSVADEPTGLDVHIAIPQDGFSDPSAIAQSDLRDTAIQLPAGMTVNPASANGLGACSPAQIALNSAADPTCPDSSKIGTVSLQTPLLDNPLSGSVYLAQQTNNPFGSLLALYIVAQGQGVTIKLPGRIDADPSTGQLTAHFDDSPQLPFSSLDVNLFGGSLAPLVNGGSCGTQTMTSTLTGWNGTSVTLPSTFTISGNGSGGPCPDPSTFKPTLSAGLKNPVAGSSSRFLVRITRTDQDQTLKSIQTTLPPGLLAKVAGVPQCSDLLANAGACPDSSLIGHVTVGVGAGSDPYYLAPGKVFLTGPYKGAPFGLDIAVPAVAGPFNLGLVNVRAALNIDPTTARVTVVSDPMPQILQGIPVLARDLRIVIDRPGFMLAPTSCAPMQVLGKITSYGGQTASASDRFQVGDCASLSYHPKLRLNLSGRGQTSVGDHPTLDAVLTQGTGQANNHTVRVALPLSLALDPNNSQHVCNYAVAQAVHGGAVGCPADTIVGHAAVVTPLLAKPLTGAVYLVQGIRYSHGQPIHTLPTLLIPLRGQIALDLRADTTVSAGELVSRFDTIPDAPVTRFTLQISGGRKGILVVTGDANLCHGPQTANVQMAAQNGKVENTPQLQIGTPCAAKHHSRRRH